MTENYDSLLGGESIPSCSFRGEPPIKWSGKVLEATKKQATEYDPVNPGGGKPRFWPDGNPIMEVWVTLQTDVRDPSRQDDDGRRVMVLDSRNKQNAVRDAVKASGSPFQQGGWLDMEFYGRDPQGKNPDNLPKLYRAQWKPADPFASTGNGWGGLPQQSPTTASTPSAPPAPPAVAPAHDPETVAFLVSQGMDAAQIKAMSPEKARTIAAALR